MPVYIIALRYCTAQAELAVFECGLLSGLENGVFVLPITHSGDICIMQFFFALCKPSFKPPEKNIIGC
jgi:hypothetical protein